MSQKQKLLMFIFMLCVFATSIIVSQTAFAAPTVKTLKVNAQPISEYVYASGVIVKGVTFTQTADKDMLIKEICVNIGDFVNSGDVIFITADDREIKAEFCGVVSQIADISTGVGAEQTLITYTDISTLTAVVNLPENDVSLVKKGQSVTLTGSAFKGRTYGGEVAAVAAEATAQAGSGVCLPVTVKLNSPDFYLRPNFTVKAKICVSTDSDTMCLPQSAVVKGASGEYVWVVSQNVATRRSVTSKAKGDKCYVSKGLINGENVVENADELQIDTVSVNVNVKAVRE